MGAAGIAGPAIADEAVRLVIDQVEAAQENAGSYSGTPPSH
jgi:hypothetical protein